MRERRRHQRYKVSENAFVFGAVHPGRITDISLAGMSFSHICDGELPETESLTILDSENQFFLEKVPCQTIARVVELSGFPASPLQVANVRVAFRLTSIQKVLLEAYIKTHAIGNA